MEHSELKRLANIRLKEAEALYAAEMYDGCVYLCGYVSEMALKACVCKRLNEEKYPDSETSIKSAFKTHDFEVLLLLAGLRSAIRQKRESSPVFNDHWNLIISWRPDLRYAINQHSETDAKDRLDALRLEPEGVLPWLSQQW